MILENELPSIKVRPIALARPMTLTFNPLRATVMTYSHAKGQCQWLVGSEDSVETERRMDGDDCITFLYNAICKIQT